MKEEPPKGLASPTVADARAFYASKPEFLRPMPYTPVPAGMPDIRAATCGACHEAIYNEWRISTHARAWLDDAQFQEELAKSTREGFDVGWTCVNCHTPMENQLPRLVAGLKEGRLEAPIYVDNPAFDAELQRDAITCATCHVRDGVILGPYGDTKAPHPVRKDPKLKSVEVCTQCHQAMEHFERIDLACFFNTGQEWAESPYAAQGQTCQHCHMPEVTRPITKLGTPPRVTRRHWFGGSLIPKKPEFAEELKALEEVYPDGLDVAWRGLPESRPQAGEVVLEVSATNAHAGHMMPSGDPERFVLIEAQVLSAEGRVLAQLKERLGKVMQWYPRVEVLSDNRLKPGQRRVWPLRFKSDGGPLTLKLKASKWRLSEENLAYHELEGRTVAGMVFFESSQALR